MKKLTSHIALLVLGVLGLGLPCADAQSGKIPALAKVSALLPPEEQKAFHQRNLDLAAKFQEFKAASDLFNAKAAKDQTDAEFDALTTQRAQYIAAAQHYNSELAARVKALESNDLMVVDARNVSSGLPSAVDSGIASVFAQSPEGVSDRVRKGFQAVVTRDWKVAIAWFEDALNRDPENSALQSLLEAARSNAQRPTDPARDPATALYRQAWNAVCDGDRNNAIVAFETALKRDPRPPGWLTSYVSYLRSTTSRQLQLPTDSDMDLLFDLPPRTYVMGANGELKEVPPNTNQDSATYIKAPDGKLLQVPQPKDAVLFNDVAPPPPKPFWKQWLDTLERPVKKQPPVDAVTSIRG